MNNYALLETGEVKLVRPFSGTYRHLVQANSKREAEKMFLRRYIRVCNAVDNLSQVTTKP